MVMMQMLNFWLTSFQADTGDIMVQMKNSKKVKILKGIDLIKPIETGMNKSTDNERNKVKIKKGIPKYNF